MNESNELLEVTRKLQALYYRQDAERRGVQLHAGRLHQIREAIKAAEARREGLAMAALTVRQNPPPAPPVPPMTPEEIAIAAVRRGLVR